VYLVDPLHNTVRGCQANKPGAQHDLYNMFKSKMFGICLRYAGNYNDAEDILQDGFLKVFEKIHQFRFKGSFEGWIRRIMVNTALEKYRLHFHHLTVDDIQNELENDSEYGIMSDINAAELMKIIQELSPKYRIVFNLYAIEGYSHKEIGELLQISEGTSKSNLSRARTILQKKVGTLYTVKVQTS